MRKFRRVCCGGPRGGGYPVVFQLPSMGGGGGGFLLEQPLALLEYLTIILQTTSDAPDLTPEGKRLCPGHERAIPIEKSVQDLDMKEEGDSNVNALSFKLFHFLPT